MDDAKPKPSGAADSADATRRRPQQPILDLKATEVASAQSVDAAQADTDAGPSRPAEKPAADAASFSSASVGPSSPDAPASKKEGEGKSPGASSQSAAESFAQGAVPPEAAGQAATTSRPAGAGAARPRKGIWGLLAAAAAGAVMGMAAAVATVWMLERTGRGDAAAQRIARIETQVQALAERPAASASGVEDVARRAAAGEEALRAVTALQERVTQAEAMLKALPPADPQLGARLGKLDETTQGLGGELAQLRKRLDEIAAAARAARETAGRVAGTSSAAVANSAEEIDALAKRVQALEAAAKSLQDRVGALPAGDRAARFAAAAQALRAAVERGDPFSPELAAVQALTDDREQLKPLQTAAASGIKNADQLGRDLSRLLADMRQAERPRVEGGVFDRLRASAAKLVRIRPVGEDAAAGGQDALARAEAQAARNDIPGALAEIEKLPPPLSPPLRTWMDEARARIAALAAARVLARDSLAALSAGTAGAQRP